MDGFIASYQLTNNVGKDLAHLKEMPTAWSNPTFLPKLFRNPGPLFMYDHLYLDQRSYENVYDLLDESEKQITKSYVEAKELDLFKIINAESVLTEKLRKKHVTQVEDSYNSLIDDTQFANLITDLCESWGKFYAAPDPKKFEAMNIPVIELLHELWSKKLRTHLFVVEDPERSFLYHYRNQKLLANILTPKLSEYVIDMAPKYFGFTPEEENWNIDVIQRLRDNKYLRNYRQKITKASQEATKNYSNAVKKIIKESNGNIDVDEYKKYLKETFDEIQSDLYNELAETHKHLQDRVAVNTWSVVGGILTTAGAAASITNPPLSLALGITGGTLILGEQVMKHFQNKSCGWVIFLEHMMDELRRPQHKFNL